MAETKNKCSGLTPKGDDIDLEVDELIENANRLLESVYRDISLSTNNRLSSVQTGPTTSRSRSPPQAPNWRDAEIERINQFCDTIDLDTMQTPETIRTGSGSHYSRARDRTLQPNCNGDDIIDLVNLSTQDFESTSTATINNSGANGNDDEDDDVIIVSSNLDSIVDLCMPERQTPHRSRSPLNQRQRTVHTTTTHIQRPQQQRQLQLPNLTAAANIEEIENVAASSSNERVVLMCPVCMESSVKRKPTSTKCGHIFCESCIQHAVRITHKCPMCNMKLNHKMIFRIYL